jgi:RNA polymerase sigma-70 factor (ECF subfamily)
MAEPETDDLQLLSRMRKGDERAFGLLYERHQGRIFRFVLHMTGSQATAEEITQEVFMLLIRKPTAYDPNKGTLSAYLFGAARNLTHRATRNSSFQVALDDTDGSDHKTASDADVLELLSNAEALDSLRRALLALPEAYREAVVLCDLQEMNYEQASAMMECSVGTVASRLHRAHKMLKTRLKHIAASNREKRNSHV